ncbi:MULTISPECIES: hypothetical protein [unclassified Streptomyces]|uniref:hypothetical protein n=1 Tax=unclassified Streptomyces TaxID=2593676 RepID=UPI00365D79CE
MRHPLHVAVSVPVSASDTVPLAGAPQARHRKPRRPVVPVSLRPGQRLAVGLGLAGVLAATVLTAVLDPAAPVAPDRAADPRSSTFAQLSAD